MKQLHNVRLAITDRWNRLGLALTLCVLAVMASQSAWAVDDQLFTDAGTAITAQIASVKTFLGIIFGVVVAFVIFTLVKRGANKA